MATRKNFLAALNGTQADRFVQFEDAALIILPGERNVGGEVQPDGTTIGLDWFGCSWTEAADKSPIGGSTITPGTQRLEELSDFAQAVPTPEWVKGWDWAGYAESELAGVDRENQVVQCRSMSGFFERMHCLIGFEDALCAFYEEPEVVEDFFAAMLEYKLAVAECVAEHFKPDVMIFDDDYGTARATFMSPDMWREFFPKYWKPLIDFVHSKGIKFELHSCGYVTPLVGDFVELGMDILQPVQTNNDLKAIKAQWGDKIVFRLAIFDKQFDRIDKPEEEIRADIRSYYEALAPGGRFIPDLVPIDDYYYVLQREVQEEYERELFGL